MTPFELNVKRVPYVPLVVATEVDISDLYGKYRVYLVHDPERKVFVITVTSHHRCAFETTQPHHCTYKLQELGMTEADAAGIQQIINDLLLPEMKRLMNR